MARPNDDKLELLLAAIASLKAEFNNLRADFLAHDHGGNDTYGSGELVINAEADALTGVAASSNVTAAVPANVKDLYSA